MKKMRCRSCLNLNYNYLSRKYEKFVDYDFCGLHGMEHVDINGFQINLDRHGYCGYIRKKEAIQLELF